MFRYRNACGRRIGVIAAITRQIGRMRPTRGRGCGRRAADARPTCGRRNADDYERRNAFLALSLEPGFYEFIFYKICA